MIENGKLEGYWFELDGQMYYGGKTQARAEFIALAKLQEYQKNHPLVISIDCTINHGFMVFQGRRVVKKQLKPVYKLGSNDANQINPKGNPPGRQR